MQLDFEQFQSKILQDVSRRILPAFVILASILATNVVSQVAQGTPRGKSVFTVDFAKAKEGEYENYLKFLKLNWFEARRIARKRKQIKSFQLLVLPETEKSDWNFILITEYGNQSQFDEREKNFGLIFKQRGVKLIGGKSSRDMADIVISKDLFSPFP